MAPFVQVAWPLSAPVEVGGPIAAGADDVYWDTEPYFDNASEYFGIGTFNSFPYHAAGRWALPIPQGATILSAKLTLRSRAATSSSVSSTIRAHAADNSAAITSYEDATGRTRTTASVSWTPGTWADATSYDSPDLTAVIQEVVNRGGWASGNYLTLFWERVSGTGFRDASSFEHAGAAPVLTVTYQASAPPPASGIAWGTPVTTDTSYTSTNPQAINIPASMNGKLCVVFFRSGRNPVYLDTPSGWTRLMPSVTNSPVAVFYRVCDGTEGGTIPINFYSDAGLTTGTNGHVLAAAYAVEGVATGESAFIEATFALSATKDPPSLTPSWGSAENEWIALYSSRYNDWTVSAYPTNYTELLFFPSARAVAIDYTALAIGRRLLTATSEDPDVFSITVGANALTVERTMTLALRPAA